MVRRYETRNFKHRSGHYERSLQDLKESQWVHECLMPVDHEVFNWRLSRCHQFDQLVAEKGQLWRGYTRTFAQRSRCLPSLPHKLQWSLVSITLENENDLSFWVRQSKHFAVWQCLETPLGSGLLHFHWRSASWLPVSIRSWSKSIQRSWIVYWDVKWCSKIISRPQSKGLNLVATVWESRLN